MSTGAGAAESTGCSGTGREGSSKQAARHRGAHGALQGEQQELKQTPSGDAARRASRKPWGTSRSGACFHHRCGSAPGHGNL